MSTDRPGGKGPPSPITLGISILTHILIILPVIYILVLAFGNYSFFSWHPICMVIGVGLLITEAILSISGEAYLSYRVSRQTRVTVHWVLHTAGVTLMTIGLIIIAVHKNDLKKRHFVTTHSQLGIVTIIFTYLVAVFGILANNTKWLYPNIRPVLIKVFHAFGGVSVMILLLATLITGIHTRWWPSTDTGRSLAFASFFISGVLILMKPILGAVSRSRVICGPPSGDT